jgi:Leucine-rich repeat (LRR) protein
LQTAAACEIFRFAPKTTFTLLTLSIYTAPPLCAQLPYNHFSGSIPDELWACTKLERICLQYNQITGGITAAIGRVKGLVQLYLDHNKLSGPLPQNAIGHCSGLERLNLANNQFSGPVPIDFGHLIKLQVLRLQHNDFVVSKAMNLNMAPQDIVTWARWERVKQVDAELDELEAA